MLAVFITIALLIDKFKEPDSAYSPEKKPLNEPVKDNTLTPNGTFQNVIFYPGKNSEEKNKTSLPQPFQKPQRIYPACEIPEDYGNEKYTSTPIKFYKYSPYLYLLNKTLEADYKIFLKKIYSLSLGEKCLFCHQNTLGYCRVKLSNGLYAHRECHANAVNEISSITTDTQLPANALSNNYDKYMLLIIANEFWPTYPDDWDQLKQIIINMADKECESCGEDQKPLHVHHKRELSTGGSNSLENLICICEDCHKEIHGHTIDGHYFKGKNRKIIDTALDQGKNIRFRYKDTKGNYTTRTAKPLHYVKSPQGASAIEAFCNLRKAERIFIIRKMSYVHVTD